MRTPERLSTAWSTSFRGFSATIPWTAALSALSGLGAATSTGSLGDSWAAEPPLPNGVPDDLFRDLDVEALDLKDCNPPGRADPSKIYAVVDSRQGDSYTVDVYYQLVKPHEVRVAWTAQIPRKSEGVTVHFYRSDGHSEFHDFENGLSQACGLHVGEVRDAASYEVRVDFGGQDVKVTSKQGWQFSLAVTLGVEGKFNIGITGVSGGSVSVSYEMTTTFVLNGEYIIETQGYLKTYEGTYENGFNYGGVSVCPTVSVCG